MALLRRTSTLRKTPNYCVRLPGRNWSEHEAAFAAPLRHHLGVMEPLNLIRGWHLYQCMVLDAFEPLIA